MHGTLLAAVVFLVVIPMNAWAGDRNTPNPLAISDRLYHSGPEGNAGLSFSVKCVTPALLATLLRLDAPVGTVGDKPYTLWNILVDADFDGGNAATADVRLSGPKPLILAFLNGLEERLREKQLLELSWNFLPFRPTAFYETEGMRPPRQGDIITVELKTPKERYLRGEPISLQGILANHGDRALTLARAQDASAHGFRYPFCVVEMKNEKGKKEGFKPVPACKTVDPLPTNAFFSLPPGATADLFPQAISLAHCFTIQQPGIYYLMVRYSTVAPYEGKWYGAYTLDYWNARLENEFWQKQEPLVQANRSFLADIDHVDVRSEWIKIEVVAETDAAPTAPVASSAAVPGTEITETDALRIAKEIFAREKWPENDILVRQNGDFWDVTSNSRALGRSGFVRLQRSTGVVVLSHLTGP
jgi:hypothetical protein